VSFDKKVFILRERRNLDYLLQVIAANWERQVQGGHPLAVTLAEETRNLEQNRLLWALLDEVSEQVDWYGQHLSREEWKDVFTAALKRQKVVPGIDGGFVVCGQRTSTMSKRDFSELVELIYAFGSDPAHPVKFSEVANFDHPEGRVA